MNELVRYEAACRAVAEAKTIDEVKDIRDKSIAMSAYARQAKNKDLEADAVEIRMRATRRLDQLRQAQKETVGLAKGGEQYHSTGVAETPVVPTLGSQGIDKNLAKQARVLGALSEEDFEASVIRTREAVARTVKIESDRNERIQNILNISKGNAEFPDGRFPIIYADPPWRYENPPIGATNRAIENHYPTMSLDEICALPVDKLATEDAVLFLWATAPKLAECIKVIEAWGFTYRTNMVWDKEKIGMGYHVRNQHELLLIAKRGEVPVPLPANRPPSVFRSERAEHSEKPLEFYRIIDAMYPELPKIELFSRGIAPLDWEVWGNQSQAAA